MDTKEYTVRDLQEYNGRCSRTWIVKCVKSGRLPEPDYHIGKNGRYMAWGKLHKIAQKK